MTEKAVETLNEQMEAERRYYLGKLGPDDKVPGSDKTVAETRKAYEEGVKIEDARMEKRRQEYLAERAEGDDQDILTTAVTHGVTRDIDLPAPGTTEPVIKSAEDVPAAVASPHTEESLAGKSKAELVAIAEEMDVTAVPDSMTKVQITDLILGREPTA